MRFANPFAHKTRRAVSSIAIAIVAATMGADAPGAEDSSTTLSPRALQEIAQVAAEIDSIEAQAIERLAAPPDNEVQQIELLGKVMLYDKALSVNRNQACSFCHMPETGFTGPVSELNRTTGSYPGSVRTRFSNRKPQSHAYAALSPVLHYNPGQGDLVGGNFWDMRATGRRLGSPAAEQAEGPPTNPVEMGLPDNACAVYRASQRPYRALFETVWGAQAFAIQWPSDVEQVCNQPGPTPANDPMPVHLTELGPVNGLHLLGFHRNQPASRAPSSSRPRCSAPPASTVTRPSERSCRRPRGGARSPSDLHT